MPKSSKTARGRKLNTTRPRRTRPSALRSSIQCRNPSDSCGVFQHVAHQRIEIGAHVAVVKIRSVTGILTFPEFLANRRLGALGTVIGFPQGHRGSLWTVKHDDDGKLAAYFISELVDSSNLPSVLVEQEADAKLRQQGIVHPEFFEPDELKVDLVFDDATNVEADMLIATISSWATWTNGINTSLMERTGKRFHHQVPYAELRNLDTFQALGDPTDKLPFKDVVFIVDDSDSHVAEIVLAALRFADDQMANTVSLPMTAFTPERHVNGSVALQLIASFSNAIAAFVASSPQHVRQIKVVITSPPSPAS